MIAGADLIVTIILVSCVFIVPLWMILHYTTGRRRARQLTSEDEKMLFDLWQQANRIEERVETLETILDEHAPNWRDKA